jgi:tetratricopeptide (TPR) repeat protein
MKTKRMRCKLKLLAVLGLLMQVGLLHAEISVKSFRKLESDMTARIDAPLKDQNGDVCAIIKVVTAQSGFVWEPDGLGIVAAVPKTSEYWLYVPFGAKRLTIKHAQLGVLRDYMYPLPIEKAGVYEMVLVTGKVITTVEETIESQWLVITPTPANSNVYLNDEFVNQGIYQSKRKSGTYTYRVEAPLYHTQAGKFEITDTKKVLSVELKPNFGYINVSSKPEDGAQVIIDGKILNSKTPCISEALKSGEYTVQVIKDMYQPVKQKVTVSDNQTTTVNFIMQPNFAELNLTAPSDAKLIINNQQKAIGSWKGRLNAGVYTLEAHMDNHRTAKQDVELIAGDLKTISLIPTPIYGALDIVTTPIGANISINGKDYGTTPTTINQLLIGNYTIKISKEDYATIQKQIYIKEKNTVSINEILKEKFEHPADYYITKGNKKFAENNYKEAIIEYSKTITIDPNNHAAYFNRGLSKAKLKDYQSAISDYNRAIEINPKDSVAYFNRGNAKYNLKDYQSAISDYNRAIEINPKDSVAYFIRGNAKYNLKDYQSAISDYNRAIDINPNYSDAYFNRGNVKCDLKDYQSAISDYTRAIEINPKDSVAHLNRGNAKYNLKDYQSAISDYTRAIEINPNYSDAYNNRGNVKHDLKDYQSAISDYTRAIEINPNYSDAYNNRGNAKYNLKDFQSAISDYNRAIEINPNYSDAYFNRGNVKCDLKDYQSAISDYNRAILLDPEDSVAYNNRALAISNLKDNLSSLTDERKKKELNEAPGNGKQIKNTKLKIGDMYAGGIVFYLDETGQHGLVCALTDQSIGIKWYNGSYTTTGARGEKVGMGKVNTERIVNSQGVGSYAAKLCADMHLNGYHDWFLPSIGELTLMYKNLHRQGMGNFASRFYCSSSEGSNSNAWGFNFDRGYTYESNKYYAHCVRAVRAF